jgi:antitoxin HicB
MLYPACFAPAEEGGYVVTFRDIPEAVTQGDTFEEAHEMAADVLVSALDFYFEDHRQVPLPSAAKEGEILVGVPASAWAKVLLLNELLAANISNSELARRMGTRPQEINRVVDLNHATKIDTLTKAFAVLGKRLVLSVSPLH